MSHELLYTSAPKGLKSGSRGFCTVVCTQGMPAPLMTTLESLSAYRHIYPPGDRNASKNPVAWSHLKMSVAGRAYHVLSRIADFGLDYSQRGNKLAHHLVFEHSEQTAGGPAWLMEQPGTLEADWDGQPRLLPAGRQLRAGSRPPSACKAWQALTGDAGWAGVLAESFLANPEQQAYIVFEPGMDLLPLIVEAIALLPAERRWDVTFSTYFTSLPPGVSCTWRCVLSGSPEAEQARKFGKALHIDLCQPVPPATGGSLVQTARNGRAATSAARPPQFAAAEWSDDEQASELQPIDDAGAEHTDAGPGVQLAEYTPAPTAGIAFGVARPPGMPPPPPPPMHGHKRRTLADMNAADAARRSKWMRRILAIVVVLLVGFGIALWKAPGQPFDGLRNRISWKKTRNDAIANNAKGSDESPSDGSPDRPKPLLPTQLEGIPNVTVGSTEATIAKNPKTGDSIPTSTLDPKSVTETPGPARRPAGADPKNDSDVTSESPRALPHDPQATDKQLPFVERITTPPDGYQLFAIGVQEAASTKEKDIRIPTHATKDSVWNLYMPKGLSGVKVKRNKTDGAEFTISQMKDEPGGPQSRPVLTLKGSVGDNGATLHFENKQDGWECVKWCLLSVISEGDRPRLFVFQKTDLELKSRRFEDYSFPLRLGPSGDEIPPSTIKVESVEIAIKGADGHFRFENESGAAVGDSLSCELPTMSDQQTLFAQIGQLITLSVNQKKDGDIVVAFPISDLNKSFNREMDRRIDKVSIELNSAPAAIKNLKISLHENTTYDSKSTNVPLKNQKDTLDRLIQDLEKQISFHRQQAKDNKVDVDQDFLRRQQDRIDAHANTIKDLELLRAGQTEYQHFRDGIRSAEITELSLSYNFQLSPNTNSRESDPPVSPSVRVNLKFRK